VWRTVVLLAMACGRLNPPDVDAQVTPGSDASGPIGDGSAKMDVWDVFVQSATWSNHMDGSPWDPNGLADPYVVVIINNVELDTSVLHAQLGSAGWNETIGTVTTADLLANGFSLEILDSDLPGDQTGGAGGASDPNHPTDDYIGGEGSVAPFDSVTHTDQLNFGGVTGSVTYRFVGR
jgi:hypothetical protein